MLLQTLEIVAPIIIVLLVVVSLFLLRHKSQKTIETWKKLARRKRGRFHMIQRKWYQGKRYKVDCEIDGVDLELSFYVVSHGKNSTTYTVVRTACDPAVHFSIYKEHFFHKIGKLVGAQDVQLGHGDYDDTFMIKSKTPELFKERFGRELRDAHLSEPRVHLMAEDGKLATRRVGLISDEDALQTMLEIAGHAAKSFGATV